MPILQLLSRCSFCWSWSLYWSLIGWSFYLAKWLCIYWSWELNLINFVHNDTLRLVASIAWSPPYSKDC